MIYRQNIFHYIIYKENLTAIVLSLKNNYHGDEKNKPDTKIQ